MDAELERPLPTRREQRLREAAAAAAPRRKAPRTSTRTRGRFLPKLVSFGAMLGAGALIVATSLPGASLQSGAADALTLPGGLQSTGHMQSLAVDRAVLATPALRDGYTVVMPVVKAKLSAKSGSTLYTNNVDGTIQWPFPEPVAISSGFGARHVTDCGFCSTFHEGVDFVPGAGTPIGAITAGVVSEAGTSGPFGNHVIIQHVINGEKVQSLYAHMISGSIVVVDGQQVTVAQKIGLVGATGDATGPHLHLEIHLDGTPVDPFAWLKANAN